MKNKINYSTLFLYMNCNNSNGEKINEVHKKIVKYTIYGNI